MQAHHPDCAGIDNQAERLHERRTISLVHEYAGRPYDGQSQTTLFRFPGDTEEFALFGAAAKVTSGIEVDAVKVTCLRQRSQRTKTGLSAYCHAAGYPANMTNKLKVATRGVCTDGSDPSYAGSDVRSHQR
jgi:hypothetical protein